MPGQFTESIVEAATLQWLEGLGYTTLQGADICPDAASAERSSYADVVLIDRLRSALTTINDKQLSGAIAQTQVKKIKLISSVEICDRFQ